MNLSSRELDYQPVSKEKPNSLKPLAITLQLPADGEASFSHPYEFELERFTPSAKQLERMKPHMYNLLEETPLVMVEHADQLPGLLQDLSSYSEITVDLENHSYRSFQGFTCLMQISRRDTDYIIDTLLLRDKLCCLNEIFTKPSITNVLLDNRQLYALRELYRWRDSISRENDESTGYVLPDLMMLQIAEHLPREMKGILSCCNLIPRLVRKNLHKLHTIVLEARNQPLVKPSELGTKVNTQNWIKVNLAGALHCPHDHTHIQDFRVGLPTLPGSTDNIHETEVGAQKIQVNKLMTSVFEAEAELDTPNHVTFVCPCGRYKKVKSFIQP
ncbi:hypothetical protein B7P43_G15291 [Cryptotermes secundus]|uniref:HRDC domain-containing protein n=1 Tax=Cryptotermes secundus TaxID=105785 RepID=A0A2J7RM62_9NEOP|nr:hypothetical protein B7P43_G15291 [Cryptotermes secundus]